MDRDTFIITVFCLVSEIYAHIVAHHPVRRGGFAPALSDEEVLPSKSAVNTSSSTQTVTFTAILPLMIATSFLTYQSAHCLSARRLICGT